MSAGAWLALSALLATVLAIPATGAMLRFSRSRGFVDRPRDDRFHSRATPLLGGVALASCAGLAAAAGWWISGSGTGAAVALLLASLVMAGLGLYDDLTNASPWLRLAIELGVALAIAAAGVRFPLTDWLAVDTVLSAAALVLLMNSFNLLDNSDAALSTVAVVTGFGICLVAVVWSVGDRAILAAAAAGAAAGFLVWNRPPARIFMGDVGSLFLGTALVGSLAFVTGGVRGPNLVEAAALLIVPVADTVVVTVTRVRQGRSILSGGRDHVHHRMARAWGTGWAAANAALVSLAGVSVAVLSASRAISAPVATLCVLVLFTGLVTWSLSQHSGHEVPERLPATA